MQVEVIVAFVIGFVVGLATRALLAAFANKPYTAISQSHVLTEDNKLADELEEMGYVREITRFGSPRGRTLRLLRLAGVVKIKYGEGDGVIRVGKHAYLVKD